MRRINVKLNLLSLRLKECSLLLSSEHLITFDTASTKVGLKNL